VNDPHGQDGRVAEGSESGREPVRPKSSDCPIILKRDMKSDASKISGSCLVCGLCSF